jgi:nucleoside-diphosphate-sugar epimerase
MGDEYKGWPENPLHADLDNVLERIEEEIDVLDGQRLFITGGTGFVGAWLLEVIVWCKERRGKGPSAEVLTRTPEQFTARLPHLAAGVVLSQGDILKEVKPAATPDFIFHAATPASATLNELNPRLMFDTIVVGMGNVLEMADAASKPRMLFTSSGAVYGRQPPELNHVSEDFLGAPDPLLSTNAYHEGKRAAELLGSIANGQGIADMVTARLFAFVGPYLPIDTHFAIGNFIRDALSGGPIIVGGDGTPVRSYQYATDMMVWLLTLLVRGEPGRAYNVGSEKEIDIATLAETVATEAGGNAVEIHGTPMPGKLAERYVPDCSRARLELGLVNHVDLEEAIRRTAQWHRAV